MILRYHDSRFAALKAEPTEAKPEELHDFALAMRRFTMVQRATIWHREWFAVWPYREGYTVQSAISNERVRCPMADALRTLL